MTTVEEALNLARELNEVSASPGLDTELLLGHVLGLGRGALHARPERVLGAKERRRFRHLLDRRAQREPVAYLLGRAGFMDFELEVNPSVLIPRPETEQLVELALETLADSRGSPLQIADPGTGSGAIAIALARHDAAWSVLGIDINEEALAVARRNAAALTAGNLRFRQGSWCEGLTPDGFDAVVVNPPYVAPGDPALHPDCAWEPAIALYSGNDGLAAIREIAAQAMRCLKSGGWLLLEHGFDQRSQAAEILAAAGFREITGFKDHAGHDRLVRACRP